MKPIRKRAYRGIEYIKLSELNEELKNDIENWLSDDVLIKIKTDQGIQRDCIQVKDFIYWYNNLYTPVSRIENTTTGEIVRTPKTLTFSLEG